MTLAELPGTTPVYVEGFGVTTLGEVRGRDRDLDSRARTVAMWGHIATNPDARPWLLQNCGHTPADSAGSIA